MFAFMEFAPLAINQTTGLRNTGKGAVGECAIAGLGSFAMFLGMMEVFPSPPRAQC